MPQLRLRQEQKVSLGDGAYAEVGGYLGQFVVTTSNGMRDTNIIYLETEGVLKLYQFMVAHTRREDYHDELRADKNPGI